MIGRRRPRAAERALAVATAAVAVWAWIELELTDAGWPTNVFLLAFVGLGLLMPLVQTLGQHDGLLQRASGIRRLRRGTPALDQYRAFGLPGRLALLLPLLWLARFTRPASRPRPSTRYPRNEDRFAVGLGLVLLGVFALAATMELALGVTRGNRLYAVAALLGLAYADQPALLWFPRLAILAIAGGAVVTRRAGRA